MVDTLFTLGRFSDEFWDWFNRDTTHDEKPAEINQSYSAGIRVKPQQRSFTETSNEQAQFGEETPANKKMRKDGKLRHIIETEAADRKGIRYDIMFGRHRPGKKSKVWEGDGYLTLVGRMAYLCTTNGRILEEPTVLDDIDMMSVKELGEFQIGSTEIQVIEPSEE